jgi:hypothetical protein
MDSMTRNFKPAFLPKVKRREAIKIWKMLFEFQNFLKTGCLLEGHLFHLFQIPLKAHFSKQALCLFKILLGAESV